MKVEENSRSLEDLEISNLHVWSFRNFGSSHLMLFAVCVEVHQQADHHHVCDER
jgi:mannose-6-phosphate isomerase-like protein (cupin superfamily)